MMKKVLIAFVISQLAPCNVLAFSLVKKTVSGISSSSSVSTSTSTSSSRFITERNVHHNGNDQSNNDISNTNNNNNNNDNTTPATRQKFISTLASSTVAIIGGSQGLLQQVQPARAESRPESLDVDNFLRTGTEAFPMGVSSQAGKSKPVTGVYLRDGTVPSRDSRTGDVLSEIVLGEKSDLTAVLVSFRSPWSLAKGTLFDVECRDAKSGDGAFLSVTEHSNQKDLSQIPTSFFLEQLFAPTGRFSFYGAPTNLKVKKSEIIDNKRIVQFSFANLSQSTNAEIPRTAIMVASIPEGLDQAVMLVGSASTTRWNKGSESAVRSTIESFNASASPKSSMKVRAKVNENLVFE